MTLTISGSTVWAITGIHGGDAWIELDGDDVCLTGRDLRAARAWLVSDANTLGLATLGPITVDESQLDAIEDGPRLDSCRHCDGPGLYVIEGWPHCPGHAAGFAQAEEDAMEAAR